MVIDPLGLTIFLVGLALLVIELASPGYFIGVPGTTGIIIGLIQMAWPDFLQGSTWGLWVVVIVAVLSFLGSVEFYRRFAPANKPPETLSSDALLGRIGQVTHAIVPNSLQGKVKVGGIVWSATGPTEIPQGTEVVVEKVDGVHLEVVPAPAAATETPSVASKSSQSKSS